MCMVRNVYMDMMNEGWCFMVWKEARLEHGVSMENAFSLTGNCFGRRHASGEEAVSVRVASDCYRVDIWEVMPVVNFSRWRIIDKCRFGNQKKIIG